MDVISNTLAEDIRAYSDRWVAAHGGQTLAVRPSHREKFHWPPHPVSYAYHLQSSDWVARDSFEVDGEKFSVIVAETSYGVFGRCDALWHEAIGKTRQDMLDNLRDAAQPLLRRQKLVQTTLEGTGRFTGSIASLSPIDHLKLLYCPDRDIASDAQSEIETHAGTGIFFEALIAILDDRKHPHRRSAQWCVLDIFESLPTFVREESKQVEANRSMRDLIWDAEDDFARTVYKAGVVLGGHIPDRHGAETLLECLTAPSKIGRRSAIHGLFHVVEWIPGMEDEVVRELRNVARTDPEPRLREFAASMADDLASHATDHVIEPIFADE